MSIDKENFGKFSSVQFMRAQIRKIQSASEDEPVTSERRLQELVGVIMQAAHRLSLSIEKVDMGLFCSAMISRRDTRSRGAVMYIHGGGFCCGSLEYAKGFGSVIAAETGADVFCPAYRLAPEHPFPAALDDCCAAYRYLLERYAPTEIVLCGESAGGGLIYSLCLKAAQEGLPLPGGLVAMSPWTDLTASGDSYISNADADPSLTPSKLRRMAEVYSDAPAQPLASPLFGDFTGFSESLIFVGGDEILLDDSVRLHERLLSFGCKSTLVVAPEMWHAYILYGLKERRQDMDAICDFIRRIVI